MKQAGIIYGSIGTSEFKFAVSDANVKRHSYVQVKHESEGDVLAQVMEIERISKVSFEDARRISLGVEVRIKDKLSATAQIIGYRDDRNILQIPRTPLEAGKAVYFADESFIKDVLGLSRKGGVYLGLLKWHDIKVRVDAKVFMERHGSILAKTGSGKSYLTGVIIEELLKNDVPVVVTDPHGEYSSLIHPNINESEFKQMKRFGVRPIGYSENVVEYSPDAEINKNAMPLKFDGNNLEARDIIELTSVRNNTHIAIITKAINNLKSRTSIYTLEDIIDVVKDDPNTAKWNVVSILESLHATKIFDEPSTNIQDLIKDGQATIINLRGVPPHIQQIVVARLATQLFEARKVGMIPSMVFVLEEAHNFCPQVKASISSPIIRTIASEGRKFGLGMIIVSQRPATIDKNVLSQCGLQVILKVTNPNDLRAIIASVEGLTSGMFDEIQRLPVGTAMIVGGDIAVPILIEVRVRETKHGGDLEVGR